ncbi:Gfo/Idh/MocA family protein [Mesobacillus selenatarsenatis]|uniref:Gfo/Idh/MocA family oxidoreductase n=1 Tax=Mesobacillus selenatarsenatis TaxID=388741 RepID=A0A846TU45_9BACI|nr:Gfo/Idh/MocA family oxidoreductase [Mesobacillus selenatarsenatis]NKE05891.1 Gfo/Idh/MocA family oxidoreductase [Mesobacillus selenatarsenatis]
MEKFRVGIIGTGFGAKVHAPMMAHHAGFDVVALSSVSRGNTEEAKKASGIENIYTDWRQMLDQEDLDLVIVASAVYLHKEMVAAAFEKGVHVVCEKPMALNIDETEEMITERDKSGKFGLINHEFRFLPARTKVKEILDSGKLGRILHVRYQCSFASYTGLISKPRGWLGQEDKGGGMLGAIGSHMTDALHWWMDSTFKAVFALLPIHVPTQTDEHGNTEHRTADDAFQIIGSLENGATVTLELLSAALQTEHTWRLEIFGTEGTLVMLDDNKVLLSAGNSALEEVELAADLEAPSTMPQIAARYYNGFQRALDALHETLLSGTKHPYLADFGHGHSTQKVLDAIRTSAREGRKVEVN